MHGYMNVKVFNYNSDMFRPLSMPSSGSSWMLYCKTSNLDKNGLILRSQFINRIHPSQQQLRYLTPVCTTRTYSMEKSPSWEANRFSVSQAIPRILRNPQVYYLVIGNRPRRTPTSHLHNSLNIQPIPVLIHRLTDKFSAHCPLKPQPHLIQQIRNYTPADLTNLYKQYKHKRTKHILL